jgi:hypothetical protein
LPLSPVESALDPRQIPILIPPLPSPIPAPLAEAAELGIRAGAGPTDGTTALPLPLAPSAPAPTSASFLAVPNGELMGVADVAPQGSPVAASVAQPLDEASAVRLEVAPTPSAPTWLDELLADAGKRSAPSTPVGAEQRAAGAQTTPPSSVPPPVAVIAPAPDAMPQLVKVARDDVSRTAPLALVGDAPVASRVDWLPSSTASTIAPNTPTSPTIAPPSTPVDVRTPNWHEAFAGRVQWLVDNNVGEARIKLNPPELGAIDVKISHVDEKSYVQLTAASAAARDELANGLHRLRELFSTSGLTLGGASVESGNAGYHDARGEALGEPRAYERLLTAPFAEAETIQSLRAAGRIDVFA